MLTHTFVIAHGVGAVPGIRRLCNNTAQPSAAFRLNGRCRRCIWPVRIQRLDGTSRAFEDRPWVYQALLAATKRKLSASRGATTLEPKSPQLWVDLAIPYQRLRNTSGATAPTSEAHKLEPDDPAFAVPADQQSTRNPEPASVAGIKHGRTIFETKSRTGNSSPNDRSPSRSPA
jgi:hypothetical protein